MGKPVSATRGEGGWAQLCHCAGRDEPAPPQYFVKAIFHFARATSQTSPTQRPNTMRPSVEPVFQTGRERGREREATECYVHVGAWILDRKLGS